MGIITGQGTVLDAERAAGDGALGLIAEPPNGNGALEGPMAVAVAAANAAILQAMQALMGGADEDGGEDDENALFFEGMQGEESDDEGEWEDPQIGNGG
jgi:hypothetical protein